MLLASARRLRAALCRSAALLALAGLGASGALAQTGTLTGTVLDGDLGETLPTANVYIPSLEKGAATDFDGNYTIRAVPAGVYDVRFSFAGYETQVVTGVEITSGATTTINVTLSSQQLGEVTVAASEIIEANTEVGLLRLRAKAPQMSDAISAATISASGSSDAGDAMERVTGASVQGGKYVLVRGLGDRYANTQLNGSTLPTADPDRRAVQFDLFPSEFLENITTLKTFTPDKPGSFSGGLVDINTKSFPAEFTASISASSGLSTEVQPGMSVLVDPAADVSFVGTADRLDIPDALLGDAPFPFVSSSEVLNASSAEGQARLAAIEANEALVDYFSSRSVAPAAGTVDPAVSLSASVGDRVRLFGNDLGFILGGTLDRGTGSYDQGVIGRYDTVGEEGLPRLRQRRTDQRSTVESNVGGIANLTYRIGGLNEVALNTLFSRSAESEARIISGPAPLPIGSDGDPITVTDRVTGYTQRDLASAQLRGRHTVPALAGLDAEWRANYATTSISEPDLRFFANANLEGQTGGDALVVGGASLNNTLHFFRDSQEDLGAAALDLTLPSRALAGFPAVFKVGGLYESTRRDFRERRFEILSEGLQLDSEGFDGVNALFSEDNSGVVAVRGPNPRDPQQRSTYTIGNRLVDNTQGNNQYDGALDVTAAYAMIEFPLLARLRVIGGARYERTDLSIDVVDRVTGAPVDASNPELSGRIQANDVLPSLNLVYAVQDDMNVRAAATRTLARPTFREIAPFSSFDFATDGPLAGNPNLNRTLITNLDLRWEWFNQPGSVVAVSGYYKFLDQPIEKVIVDNENGIQKYQNVDQATLFGAELEARQALATFGGVFDAPVLRDLSVGGNLTLTQSEITIGADELAERRRIDPEAADTRALQGQSPFLVNLDLAYDNARSGTSAGLYFNVFGERLSRVGVPDVYEKPSPQLDLVASQKVFDQFKIKLSIKNLLNQNLEEVYDFPASTYAAIGGQAPVYQSYARGTSFSLGLSFSPRFGGPTGGVPPVPDPAGGIPIGG